MGAEFRGRRNQAWGWGLEVGGARHGVEFEGRRGQALGWELNVLWDVAWRGCLVGFNYSSHLVTSL